MTDLKFTSPSGETTIKFEETGRIGTVAPKTQLHIKMDEPVKYETPMTAIEDIEAQIKVLQSKLEFYKELERTKTPCEEAYKRVYGFYPETYEDSWSAFQDGYIAAQKDYKVGEFQETAQERGERVHNEMEETIKIHDGYGVVDYKPTPQTPVEEAYKDWWGDYPELETDSNYDLTRWAGFQAGYEFAWAIAHAKKVVEKVQEEQEEDEWKSVALRFGEKLSGYLSDGYYELSPASWFRWAVFTYGKGQQIKDAVRESVKWCEENPDKSVEDYLTPKTPEQTAQSLKEAFVEAQKTEKWKEIQKLIDEEDNDKNFKNSLDLIKEWGEKNKSKTLYQLIEDWWSDIFCANSMDDMETCIDGLVDRIDKKFIPPSHDTNDYQWNKCLKIMRDKLR